MRNRQIHCLTEEHTPWNQSEVARVKMAGTHRQKGGVLGVCVANLINWQDFCERLICFCLDVGILSPNGLFQEVLSVRAQSIHV